MTHLDSQIEVPIDRIRQPVQRIIHLENLSGIALILSAATALILANSPLAESVDHFWHLHFEVKVGAIELDESLLHWVNDALMTLFFFVAGLEIKRELVVGDLRDPRKAALPAVAALGGMVVPAAFYLLLSDAATRGGWGIPMATDIAFAVGILTLLGNRVPGRLKVFLLTLAIVDDLGAIVVIAIFYTSTLDTTALAIAGGLLVAMVAFRVLGVWWMPLYVLVGVGLWLAVFESGVHATLAGVACGLLAPARPRRPHRTKVDAHPHATIDELKAIIFDTRETKSIVDRLIHGLHPFVALAIVPVFALANTGVPVSLAAIGDTFTSPVGLAIGVGLVVGKPVGIATASWLAVKSGIAALPSGSSFGHIIGVGLLGGIGFTVSLFITDLAFDDPLVVDQAKISVLSASILASVLGASLLLRARHPAIDPGPITFDEFNATRPEAFLAGTGSPGPEPGAAEAATETAPSAQ
jgi:NhaA family Na+:H+ antiporter